MDGGFYHMYLTGVCRRRQWPKPIYDSFSARKGYGCKVRVNNREYCTDYPYETEDMARAGAAMKAYMICRNFSANDGMYPGQRPGQVPANGVVQGLPAAIGTGRRSNRDSTASSGSSSSGSNSPKSSGHGFEHDTPRVAQELPRPAPRRTHRVEEYMCQCRRGVVQGYGACYWCARERGWA